MNLSDIRTLYAYNRWANRRMFAALDKLTQEEFVAVRQSSFPSIQESAFHILAAEWVWLKRWKGTSPGAGRPVSNLSSTTWTILKAGGESPPGDLNTLPALGTFAETLDREREQFLGSLNEETLHAPLHFHDMSGTPYAEPLVHLMQHVVNHGSYHRGQVTTLLRQAGAETIALDMLYFFREEQEKAAGAGKY